MTGYKLTKEAKIDCPHCGKPITVRQTDSKSFEVDTAPIWKAMDDTFKSVEDAFKKVFGK